MTLLRIVILLAALAAAGCSSPGADCRAVDGWRQGGAGLTALPGCVNRGYREAHELGSSLQALQVERASIDAQILEEPDAAAALRRRQRQIDVDIEAIRGLAVIEGWDLPQR